MSAAAATPARRRLYVYYKVADGELAGVLAAARTMQAALCAAHPGLQAELLRRPGAPGGLATVMEAYAGTLDDAAEAAIAEAGARLPQPRHAEHFDLLP